MRKLAKLAIIFAIMGAPAYAGKPTYKRWGMFGGYKDKLIAPNRWRVEAGVNGQADEGSAQRVAVYRAAELAHIAGFRYMQIVNQKGSQTMLGIGYSTPNIRGGASMKLEIIGTQTDAPPSECLAKQSEGCFSVAVDEAMNNLRPYLRFPED